MNSIFSKQRSVGTRASGKTVGILLTIGLFIASAIGQDVNIKILNKSPKWVISKYLTGSHLVYAYEKDQIYRSPVVIDWMKRAKVNVIRYPGGTVTMYYHWNDLNGYAFPYHVKQLTGEKGSPDTWSRDYRDLPVRDGSEFMDLDEYLKFCTKVGAETMLGLNIRSGRLYRKREDSLEEARALISYVKKSGYNVPFWYVGNEVYAKNIGVKPYIDDIDDYGKLVKESFPNALIIADWKYGPVSKKRFETSLEIIRRSEMIDVMEYHEKWGNDWGLYSGKTKDEWLAQAPFIYNGKFSEMYQRFDAVEAKLGRTIHHAHNEWGIGGHLKEMNGDFDYALLAADFLIEIFRHPTFMACYWNLNMGPMSSRIFRVEKNGDITLQSPALTFELIAQAMEQVLVEIESSDKATYGFSVKNRKSGGYQMFLLNKSSVKKVLSVSMENGKTQFTGGQVLISPGKIVPIKIGNGQISLPPMSFSVVNLRERRKE